MAAKPRKLRNTQNAVFIAGPGNTRTVARITDDPKSVTSYLEGFNALSTVQGQEQRETGGPDSKPIFLDKDGKDTTEETEIPAMVLIWLDADGKQTQTNTGVPFIPAAKRSGYDKYVNGHGFINPESPNDLPVQGLAKVIAKSMESLSQYISVGNDTERTEAIAALTGLQAFGAGLTVNAEQLREVHNLRQAILALGVGNAMSDGLRKQAKDKGLKLPADCFRPKTVAA